MTKALRFLAALLLAFPAFAQAQRTYSPPELDQMLAPIALYPDALLSQVLMAATYPLEVVEAARWSRANPGLQGDNAVRAVQNEDWDPSVKSLVALPQILQRMDEHLDWTRALGDAFLAQQPQLMDQVQQLRQRAQSAGNLRSDERIRVEQQGPVILVRPASPQFVYVPYYDPLQVYGPWWWPGYQPVVWAPWPGYVRPYRPGLSVGFWWGRPVGLSLNFLFGDFDWHRRHVRAAQPSAYYYRPTVGPHRTIVVTPQRWQHDARRREAFVQQRPVWIQQQIQVQTQIQRQERRAIWREERPAARVQAQPVAPVQVQAQPAAPVQVQAQPQPAAQPRAERREERQAARVQAQPVAPVQVQAQPVAPVQVQAQPAAPVQVRAQPAAPVQVRAQPAAPVQVQAQPAAPVQVQARPAAPVQVHAQPRPGMPAAQVLQTPRADRLEQLRERRELRQERREDRWQKAG